MRAGCCISRQQECRILPRMLIFPAMWNLGSHFLPSSESTTSQSRTCGAGGWHALRLCEGRVFPAPTPSAKPQSVPPGTFLLSVRYVPCDLSERSNSALLPVALDEGGIDLAGDEGGVVEDLAVQRDGGVNALD